LASNVASFSFFSLDAGRGKNAERGKETKKVDGVNKKLPAAPSS